MAWIRSAIGCIGDLLRTVLEKLEDVEFMREAFSWMMGYWYNQLVIEIDPEQGEDIYSWIQRWAITLGIILMRNANGPGLDDVDMDRMAMMMAR